MSYTLYNLKLMYKLLIKQCCKVKWFISQCNNDTEDILTSLLAGGSIGTGIIPAIRQP